MTPRRIRRPFSFPVMLASTLVALAVLTVRSRFNDPDLWWHLRTGQIIWTNRAVPRTDLLSFTTGQHAWVPHEWLSQLSIYAAWRAGDYFGLMLWFCIATAALLVIQYVSCSLYSGNAKVAFLGALVTWFFATVGLAIRPQLLGFTLLACELLILHLGRSRDRRWFYLLPLLFAVWVNLHGSFFFGMIVLAMVLVCGFVKGRRACCISRPLDPARRKTLLWAAALSVAGLFVNPVGIDLLAYPLRTIFDQRMQLDAVAEWQRLSFDDVRAFGLLALAGAIVLDRAGSPDGTVLGRGRAAGGGLRHGDSASALAVRLGHRRGADSLPSACRCVGWSPAGSRPNPAQRRSHSRVAGPRRHCFPGAERAGFAGAPRQSGRSRRLHPPTRTSPDRMLNEYVYGGYLSWALPEQKVFIDGRADVYAWTGVFEDYGAWATLREDPNRLSG